MPPEAPPPGAGRSGEVPPLFCERAGSGRRLVLVHGMGQTGRSWARAASALATGHEVVTVDLPCHGRSAEVDVSGLGEAAELLGRSCGAATYVGYFLGGKVCLSLALKRPELVEALVLLGSIAGVDDEAERAERRAAELLMADRLDAPPPASAQALLLERVLERLDRPDFHMDAATRAAEMAACLENTPHGYAMALRRLGTGAEPSTLERLGELEMPVLVLAGEHDAHFRGVAADLVARIGENAEFVLVPGGGHPAPFEQPEAFAGILSAWLASRLEGGAGVRASREEGD